MREKKEKKGRVKVESLPQKERELDGGQAANIKGGAGNSGAGGGDVRSITGGNPQLRTA